MAGQRARRRADRGRGARDGISKATTGHDDPRAYLAGFASYVAMVQPELGRKLRAEVDRLLAAPG